MLSEAINHPRIARDPAIMGGKPCIKGTRVPVYIILRYLASGETVEQLLEGYPHLTHDDVMAVLDYASDYIATEGTIAA